MEYRITSAGKNIRQVWTAVKDLLHVDHGSYPVRLPLFTNKLDNSSFSSKLVVYFVNKSTIFVQTLRSC